MKEELKNLLLQNLNDIIVAGKKGTGNLLDLLYAQCPDLINQIVKYGIASNLLYTLCGIAEIALFILCLIYCIKKWKLKKYNNDYMPIFGVFAWWGLCNFLVIMITLTFAENALKAIIAPKLYLIEYIKNLLG